MVDKNLIYSGFLIRICLLQMPDILSFIFCMIFIFQHCPYLLNGKLDRITVTWLNTII